MTHTQHFTHDHHPSTRIHTRVILWATFACISSMLAWAYFATVDEVTSGHGKIIPSSQVQVIQNLEGGIIQQILVQEGDVVEKNQTLMLIDDTRFASSFKGSAIKIHALQAKIARLSAEAHHKPLNFNHTLQQQFPNLVEAETKLHQSRQRENQTKLDILHNQLKQRHSEKNELSSKQQQHRKNLQLLQQELDMTQPLLQSGAVSPVEVLRLERQLNEVHGNLSTIQATLPKLDAAIAEALNKIQEFQSSIQSQRLQDIAAAKAELASLQENQTALQDRVNRTTVRSPVKGTIKSINVTTVGGVIQPGMELIEIVPLDDTLLVEAYVRPADIAFLRPGQKANVKVSAYDYGIYGGLTAQIEHISADTIQNERDEHLYEIHVRTQQHLLDKNGSPLPIIPGMMVSVDILTGHKTILDYLLKPILKAKQNALSER